MGEQPRLGEAPELPACGVCCGRDLRGCLVVGVARAVALYHADAWATLQRHHVAALDTARAVGQSPRTARVRRGPGPGRRGSGPGAGRVAVLWSCGAGGSAPCLAGWPGPPPALMVPAPGHQAHHLLRAWRPEVRPVLHAILGWPHTLQRLAACGWGDPGRAGRPLAPTLHQERRRPRLPHHAVPPQAQGATPGARPSHPGGASAGRGRTRPGGYGRAAARVSTPSRQQARRWQSGSRRKSCWRALRMRGASSAATRRSGMGSSRPPRGP